MMRDAAAAQSPLAAIIAATGPPTSVAHHYCSTIRREHREGPITTKKPRKDQLIIANRRCLLPIAADQTRPPPYGHGRKQQ